MLTVEYDYYYEVQDKRRIIRRAKRKSDRSRASRTIDTEGKPRHDLGRSDRVVRDDSIMKQSTSTLLMVKPHGFDYNAQTAKDNHFQTGGTALSSAEITSQALHEFEDFVKFGNSIAVDDPKVFGNMIDSINRA